MAANCGADSAGYAGRVMDRLDRELGRDLVSMDVDAIPLGTNFSKVLHEELAKSGVLLAVIGPNWLDARDEHGKRRLNNPNDFIRIEIAAALQRSISTKNSILILRGISRHRSAQPRGA
jgi:hypothetical protein